MKAMILAAGRGERLRPLTDHTPKPLLPVAGKPLIEYTIDALVTAGFCELVINHAHLGHKLVSALGNGSKYGANIAFSDEGDDPLETAGGIINALPLLGDAPFLVVNGDIATDFPFASLKDKEVSHAHLILIENPPHHQDGDFGLIDNLVSEEAEKHYTFSGIGVYHPRLFEYYQPGKTRLGPLLRTAMKQSLVTGQFYDGFWMDIGTEQRLQELENIYKTGAQHV